MKVKYFKPLKENRKSLISINGPSFWCLFAFTILLTFLKIENYLDWNWIWILSPLWLSYLIPIALYLLLLTIWLLGNILLIVIDTISDQRRKNRNRF